MTHVLVPASELRSALGALSGAAPEHDCSLLLDALEGQRSTVDSIPHVHPEVVKLERELGWPDFHPETFCHRCGGRNVWSWCVDGDEWEKATAGLPRREASILCPPCFTALWEQATGVKTTWRLVRE